MNDLVLRHDVALCFDVNSNMYHVFLAVFMMGYLDTSENNPVIIIYASAMVDTDK